MSDDPIEIWKVIEEFPNYSISNKSNVRNNKTNYALLVCIRNTVKFDYNNKRHTRSIVKLMRLYFPEVSLREEMIKYNRDPEVWKVIEEFPNFSISNKSNIRNSKYYKLVHNKKNNTVNLGNLEHQNIVYVPKLMAQYFPLTQLSSMTNTPGVTMQRINGLMKQFNNFSKPY
jgi:hypothetical protein